jgi:AraC-like DNA-binding protein
MSINQIMPINYVRLIARELQLKEGDLALLLQDTALEPADLQTGGATLTVAEQFTILRNALNISGDAALGFRIGKLLHVSTHGSLGMAALTSTNLHEAITALCDYARIRAPFIHIEAEIKGQQMVLAIQSSLDIDADIRPTTMEGFCMLIQQIVEFVITRELDDGEVLLDYSPPAHAEAYRREFHSPVRFDCDRVEFRVPRSLLSTPCPTADRDAYLHATQLCRETLRKLIGNDSTEAQVKRILLASPLGTISQQAVAQQLCITPRTLIRRLKHENTSYRNVHESVLTELARQYLTEQSISVDVVAELLGYSDAANFRRAFKRWHGATPQQYRESKLSYRSQQQINKTKLGANA